MHEEGLTNANATQRIHEDTPRRFDQRVGVFVARGFLLLKQGIECLFESLEKYHEYPRLRRGGFVSWERPALACKTQRDASRGNLQGGKGNRQSLVVRYCGHSDAVGFGTK